MGDSLAQFLVWWDSPDGKQRAVDEQETTYRIAQRAFEAGQQTQPAQPLQPSRDALSDKHRRILARYAPPRPVQYPGPMPMPGEQSPGWRTAQPSFTPISDIKTRQERGLDPDYVQHGTMTGRFVIEGPPLDLKPFVEIYKHPPGIFEHVQTLWNGPDDHEGSPATMSMPVVEDHEGDFGPPGPVVTPLLGSEDL